MTDKMAVAMAISVATESHGDQMYGDRPYIGHLSDVAKLVEEFGAEAVVVAFLHDVVEDTKATLEQIATTFGDRIATMVGYVTDEPGINRRERKAATNAKLAKVTDEHSTALRVKAADRLANMRGGAKLDMYRREYPAFREAVYRPGLCDNLWEEMDRIVSG